MIINYDYFPGSLLFVVSGAINPEDGQDLLLCFLHPLHHFVPKDSLMSC